MVAAGGVLVGVFGVPHCRVDLVNVQARKVVLVAVHHRRVARFLDALAECLRVLGKLVGRKVVGTARGIGNGFLVVHHRVGNACAVDEAQNVFRFLKRLVFAGGLREEVHAIGKAYPRCALNVLEIAFVGVELAFGRSAPSTAEHGEVDAVVLHGLPVDRAL